MNWTEADLQRHLLTHRGLKVLQGTVPSRAPEGLLERTFQGDIVRLAQQYGWLTYHTYDSRRSAPGYPDLTLAKPGHPLVFAELKRQPEKLTQPQVIWQEVLRRVTTVQSLVWRPGDWDTIAALLTAPTP